MAEQNTRIYMEDNIYILEFMKTVTETVTIEIFFYDLSAIIVTLVTKDEFESKLLSKPTEEPILNHWVNTTFNQLMIQFEPSCMCI